MCVCCLQLLFLVKKFDEAGRSPMCEEWCEVLPGHLPMWLMVKNYLMQYILLEATYLRSSCCVTGAVRPWQRLLHSLFDGGATRRARLSST